MISIQRTRSRIATFALLAAFMSARTAAAQQATDVYLIPVHTMPGMIHAGAALNISASRGYDNQPSFTPTGDAILFSSVREGGQADIYRYDIARRALTRLTTGPESEYSPLVTPDPSYFSTVRVERDSVQRLWRFPMEGGTPALVLENVRPVGYHAWLGDTTLALFVLGSPNTLQIASSRSGTSRVVASNVGRSIHAIPGTSLFSFVDKSEQQWWVASVDPVTGTVTRLVATSGRSEDLAWLDGNTILCSDGTRLLASRRSGSTFSDWAPVVDLGALGLRSVSRLAVSPAGDMLAVVAAEPDSSRAVPPMARHTPQGRRR